MTKPAVENDFPTSAEALKDAIKDLKYIVHTVIRTEMFTAILILGARIIFWKCDHKTTIRIASLPQT